MKNQNHVLLATFTGEMGITIHEFFKVGCENEIQKYAVKHKIKHNDTSDTYICDADYQQLLEYVL